MPLDLRTRRRAEPFMSATVSPSFKSSALSSTVNGTGHEGSSREWEQTLDRKKEDLDALLRVLERKRKRRDASSMAVVCLHEAIELSDMDVFQGAIRRLATQFASRDLARLFSKYVYPTLDHVRFFKDALSCVMQADPTGAGSLVWGVLFIVIQCGCMFAESLEKMMEEIGLMQRMLPSVQRDCNMYPTNSELKFKLRGIFDDYVDFCIAAIRNLARNPFKALLRNLGTSSVQHNLKRLTAKLKRDVDEFDRAVRQAERDRSKEADTTLQLGIETLTAQLSGVMSRSPSCPYSSRFPVFSVNITENLDFVGRESQLAALNKLLIQEHDQPEPVSCTLYGNPGVGKTQAALKFVYQHRTQFDAVFWVSADPEQGTETLRTYGNIGRRLGLFENEEVDEGQVEIVLNWLQTAEQTWLLVFDNVVDWRSIARYWPTTSRSPCAIIATSQKTTHWVPAERRIAVDYLDDSLGSELLLRHMRMAEDDVTPDDRRLAREISNELGGSPLYLSQAQGFMALSDTTLEEYLGLIRERSNILASMSSNQWMYDRAVSATHDSLIKQLDPGAVDLLYMLSFMNPDEVGEDILLSNHKDDSLDFLRDRPTYLSYVTQLVEGHLIQRDKTVTPQAANGSKTNRYLRMHRSTREAMLLRLNDHPRDREVAFGRVTSLLREYFPSPSKLQIADAQNWPRLTRVLPHLLSATSAFERAWPRIAGNLFFAQLASDVGGMDLHDRGFYTEAYSLNQTVEKILDSLNCPLQTPLRGDVLTIRGLCTDNMALSKRQEGLDLRQRVQQIRQLCFQAIPPGEVTQEDKIRLYNSYTDLVCSQQQSNDFDSVRKNLLECLEQYQSWGPEDKEDLAYEYAKYYNQMAYVLLWENESAKAVEFSRKAYELVERAAPNTVIARIYQSDYAHLLFQKGDRGEALGIMRTLLRLSEQDCGKDNVRTLEIRLDVGIMSYFMNDLSYAEEQIHNTVTAGENLAGWPFENTVRGKYYLSQVLQQNSNEKTPKTEALQLEEKAKEDLYQLLQLDRSRMAARYGNNFPMLFDYLVHWENRLVTPRKDDALKDSTDPISNNVGG